MMKEKIAEKEPLLNTRRIKKEDLLHARFSVYLFLLFAQSSWGVYNATYTFLLTKVGNYSYSMAAYYATGEWLGYALFQGISNPIWGALSDRIGRRPVLLIAQTVVMIGMTCLAYPNGYWYLGVGIIQGLFDCTWSIANVLIVDCVANGVTPGDSSDIFFIRFLRLIIERFNKPEEESILLPTGRISSGGYIGNPTNQVDHRTRHVLSVAFIIIFIIMGFGTLCGYGIGFLLISSFSLQFSMACTGLLMFIPLLYFALFLPETRPDQRGIPFTGGFDNIDHSEATLLDTIIESFQAQLTTARFLFHSKRSSLLSCSYALLYLYLTGIYNVALFWGEEVYGWPALYTTIFLIINALATGIGLLILQYFLIPSFKFSLGISILSAISSLGALALFLKFETKNSPIILFFFISVSFFCLGAYPILTGLLTAEIEYESQGHLQGTLYAYTTFASLFGLVIFLIFFELVAINSIWLLATIFIAIASAATFFAGEGEPVISSSAAANIASLPRV
mmetsp:Transcript_4840/g.6848  ORF Transcript_4840/g.6848 Transcript_4840/m.6848 type:complete len:508 (+) Transcript_4840:51-1574(+)